MNEYYAFSRKDVMLILPKDLGKGSSIKVEVLGTPEDIYNDMARVMANKIKENNASGKITTFVLPVGPTGQYRRLARICNLEGISCRDLVTFNMDEYCASDNSSVPVNHPMSFRGFMKRDFFSLLDDDKKVKDENKFFPDPKDLEFIARKIEEAGGIDICFGGIGINGHIAFNEPLAGKQADIEKFKNLGARVLDITKETVVVNAIYGAGGDLEAIPPRCVTIGMKEILASRELHFYLEWPWQSAVVRKAVHGPLTPAFPASFLQIHPNCTITIASCVALLPGAVPK